MARLGGFVAAMVLIVAALAAHISVQMLAQAGRDESKQKEGGKAIDAKDANQEVDRDEGKGKEAREAVDTKDANQEAEEATAKAEEEAKEAAQQGGSSSSSTKLSDEEFAQQLCQPEVKVPRRWKYNPVNGRPAFIRTGASIDAASSEHVMKPGEVFLVSEERRATNDVVYLKLADGRGWMFDHKPGTMCEPSEGGSSSSSTKLSDEEFAQQVLQPDLEVHRPWKYNPVNGMKARIRTEPNIDADPSANVMKPGAVFYVSKELRASNDVVYLKLADGRGWMFDHIPGKRIGAMCELSKEKRLAK